MKPDFKKYIVGQANKFFWIFEDRDMANQASYWSWWSKTLQYLDQLPIDVCEHIHTINWLLKKTKHS